MAESEIEAKEEKPMSPEAEEMIAAGLHFGHQTSKTHPKMKPFIAGIRSAVHIIDVTKTKEKLEEAIGFLRQIREDGKTTLIIGTKVQIRGLVKETALELKEPYVMERWIGGTLTNFETIHKQIERLKELRSQQDSEEFQKYTKWEQLQVQEEIRNLETRFGGIENMDKLPDAMFIVDLDENELAFKEAKRKGIPVVAIVDTNVNPTGVDYMIPANDDAISSVKFILGKVIAALAGAKE